MRRVQHFLFVMQNTLFAFILYSPEKVLIKKMSGSKLDSAKTNHLRQTIVENALRI